MMKRSISERTFSVYVLSLGVAAAVLWAIWFFMYPYFMRWMEGYSFFSTIPDYTGIMLDSFKDMPRYIGAFFLQFYKYPALGALIQALVPVGVTACAGIIIRKVFRGPDHLLWAAFLLLPFAVFIQLGDTDISKSVAMLLIAAASALAVSVAAFCKRNFLPCPSVLRHYILMITLPVVSVGFAVYVLLDNDKLGRYHEEVARLEYLGENADWDGILRTVSRQDALINKFARRYVLLALSETGRLPDYAFSYGLSDADDFLFQQEDYLFCRSFNVLFYRALGLTNPAVYHSYHYSLQSSYGVCFDAVRYLADLYIGLKDYTLAKKYIDILSHTSCHGRWIRERQAAMNRIRNAEPSYSGSPDRFIFTSFIPDMTSLVQRYPESRKYVDYLLCATLAEKDAESFMRIFSQYGPYAYKNGIPVPRLYQEALVLIASQNPDVLKRFNVEKEIWNCFVDFTDLMQKGRSSEAKRKYAETYWAYVY